MNWPVFHLLVPKLNRTFLVCAPNVEQAHLSVKYHAAILVAIAREQLR